MSRAPPPCKDGFAFLRHPPASPLARPESHGRSALAGLTGQDTLALEAFAHLVALYGSADAYGQRHALQAMVHAAGAMQPKMRHLAKEVIARMLDWSDRERLWALIEQAAHGILRLPSAAGPLLPVHVSGVQLDPARGTARRTTMAEDPKLGEAPRLLVPLAITGSDEIRATITGVSEPKPCGPDGYTPCNVMGQCPNHNKDND